MKCPYYQGVCGLDDSIICYTDSNSCNIYKNHKEEMRKVIDEAMAIVDNSDFNSLPFEERKRIAKYSTEQQILTLVQLIEKDSHITTKLWRDKQIEWLKNIVKSYNSEWA